MRDSLGLDNWDLTEERKILTNIIGSQDVVIIETSRNPSTNSVSLAQTIRRGGDRRRGYPVVWCPVLDRAPRLARAHLLSDDGRALWDGQVVRNALFVLPARGLASDQFAPRKDLPSLALEFPRQGFGTLDRIRGFDHSAHPRPRRDAATLVPTEYPIRLSERRSRARDFDGAVYRDNRRGAHFAAKIGNVEPARGAADGSEKVIC